MKARYESILPALGLAFVFGSGVCVLPAHAQGPGDGPPGQGPQDGPPPPGGPGGFGPGGQRGPGDPSRPGMRGMNQPPMTMLHLPIEVLASELRLTGAQKDKISQLQRQFREQARPPQPPQDGQGDTPPDPEAMRARMDKMRSLDQSMTKQIENVLTAGQKQELPGLYKTLEGLRAARIPLPVLSDLHLTADQKQQFATLSDRAGQQNPRRQQEGDQARRSGQFGATRNLGGPSDQQHEKGMAILTAEQRKTVTDYIEKHPRPQGGPGGPGGFGPGGQRGPGGPGGPGGPDMPPPPGGAGGGEGDGPPPPPPGE